MAGLEQGTHSALVDLRGELRGGLEDVQASVTDLSDRLREASHCHRQALRDILMAIDSLRQEEANGHKVPSNQQSKQVRPSVALDCQPEGGGACSEQTSSVSNDAGIASGQASSRGLPSGADISRFASRLDWRQEARLPQGIEELLRPASDMQRSCRDRFQKMRQVARYFRIRYGVWLDSLVATLIAVNSICIGIEIQNSLDGVESPVLTALEDIFLTLFLVELCMRVLSDDGHYLWSFWFFLDISLVTIGVVSRWIVVPILAYSSRESASALDQILLLRILRLLRLARALRLIELFEEVLRLLTGMLRSIKTVFTACMLVLLMVYFFACLGVEAFHTSSALKANPETNEIIQHRFSNLLRMMLTLLAWTSGDSIAVLYEPIIVANHWFAIFFGLVWIFVTISLMNLVTAVIVDTAIQQTKEDHHEKHLRVRKLAKKLVPEIELVFDTLDEDQTGLLDRSEVSLTGIELPPEVKKVIAGDENKIIDLFAFLDVDESNTLDKKEFVDGIMHLMLQNVPIETTQMLQVLRTQQKMITSVHSDLKNVLFDLSHMHGNLKELRRLVQRDSPDADEVAGEGACACPASRPTS